MPFVSRRRAPRHVLRSAQGRRVDRGPRRRRHRRPRWGAIALGAVAMTCAAYLSWEFAGTNWVARSQQRAAVTALTSAWGHHTPSTTQGGVAVDAIVRIPRFGPTYAVPLVEGIGPQGLALGIGHVVGTAHPGGVGNMVLAGHRVTHGEPFRRLPTLRPGDEVIIDTITLTYVYRVTDDADQPLRVHDDATWILASAPHDPQRSGTGPPHSRRLITLVTCADLFHTPDRLVVFGELLRTYPRVRDTSAT